MDFSSFGLIITIPSLAYKKRNGKRQILRLRHCIRKMGSCAVVRSSDSGSNHELIPRTTIAPLLLPYTFEIPHIYFFSSLRRHLLLRSLTSLLLSVLHRFVGWVEIKQLARFWSSQCLLHGFLLTTEVGARGRRLESAFTFVKGQELECQEVIDLLR